MKRLIAISLTILALTFFFLTHTITINIERREADALASSSSADTVALFEALDDRLTAIELIVVEMYDEENKTIRSKSIDWSGMNDVFDIFNKRFISLEASVDGYLMPAVQQLQEWVTHILAKCDCKHTPK